MSQAPIVQEIIARSNLPAADVTCVDGYPFKNRADWFRASIAGVRVNVRASMTRPWSHQATERVPSNQVQALCKA